MKRFWIYPTHCWNSPLFPFYGKVHTTHNLKSICGIIWRAKLSSKPQTFTWPKNDWQLTYFWKRTMQIFLCCWLHHATSSADWLGPISDHQIFTPLLLIIFLIFNLNFILIFNQVFSLLSLFFYALFLLICCSVSSTLFRQNSLVHFFLFD